MSGERPGSAPVGPAAAPADSLAPRAPAPTGARSATRWPVWTAFALFSIAMGALSLARYVTFHSRSLDMAYYVRLVWGMAHGRYDQPIVDAPNLLGLHLEPILVPFALLARAGLPIAETLLVAQALATAAAIFPAAALARRRLGPVVGPRWALAAAFTIYLLPTVTRCVDYDFHPSTMVVWPLLALINALDAGHLRRAVGWAAAALLFREDVGLQLACVAATIAIWPIDARTSTPEGLRRQRATAVALVVVGLAWFFVYTLAVQPHWLPPAAKGSFGAHFGRFGGGAGGVGGVLGAALAHPADLLRYLASGDRLVYPVLLLAQTAFLGILAPRWLAGALPIVAINLLSDLPNVRSLQAHYVTAAAPFLAAAGIAGAARIAARLRWKPVAALVTAALIAWLARGASPLSPEWRTSAYFFTPETRQLRDAALKIPADAVVAAPSPVAAHLAERVTIRIARRPN